MRSRYLKKLTSYVLVAALAIALIPGGLLMPMTVSAANLDIGTWVNNPRYVTFGQYNGHDLKWRVLEITDNHPHNPGNKTAFLLLDDVLLQADGQAFEREFHHVGSVWRGSSIRSFLNGTFFTQAFSLSQQDTMLPYIWSNEETGVLLLSLEEATNPNYFPSISDLRVKSSLGWWLRTRGEHMNSLATALHVNFYAGNDGTPTRYFMAMDAAVRPAIRVNLSSAYFAGGGGVWETGFGLNPRTGIADVTGAAVGMVVLAVISAGLWGYIFLRRRRRNG